MVSKSKLCMLVISVTFSMLFVVRLGVDSSSCPECKRENTQASIDIWKSFERRGYGVGVGTCQKDKNGKDKCKNDSKSGAPSQQPQGRDNALFKGFVFAAVVLFVMKIGLDYYEF